MSVEEINNDQQENKQEKNLITKGKDYEIVVEEFTYFDLCFKIIVIGNSGKKILLFIKHYF